MILHHVAHHPGLLVKPRARADTDVLGHGDLYVVDVVTVPDRFEAGIREAHHQQVLHRFLAEEMIDTVGLVFVKDFQNSLVEFTRRALVGAEGFLDHQAPPAAIALGQPGRVEPADDPAEKRRRRGQMKQDVVGDAVAFLQRLQLVAQQGVVAFGRRIEISRHVVEVGREAFPVLGVERALLGDGAAHPLAEGLVVPVVAGKSDDGERLREQRLAGEIVQRRDEFAPRQIAGGAEHHDAARLGGPAGA